MDDMMTMDTYLLSEENDEIILKLRIQADRYIYTERFWLVGCLGKKILLKRLVLCWFTYY